TIRCTAQTLAGRNPGRARLQLSALSRTTKPPTRRCQGEKGTLAATPRRDEHPSRGASRRAGAPRGQGGQAGGTRLDPVSERACAERGGASNRRHQTVRVRRLPGVHKRVSANRFESRLGSGYRGLLTRKE